MKVILTICLAVLAPFASRPAAAQSPTTFNQRKAAELFAIDHVPKFEFTLPDDQWQWLQAHAAEEEAVRAEARFDGQPIGAVGLRFKGGVGSLERCVDKTGALTCPKLSFKLLFDKYDAANQFFGLKRLNLHAMVGDPSKLHERLAYDLFQLSGIKAPRSSWATAIVNGKNFGLFSMVEEIDDRFTADRWPGRGNGTLTKEVWPQADAVKPDALAYMARYMAVDDALNDCDGVTAMYSADATSPESHNHNFFWYQEPNGGASWLIPWDMGQTFTGCDTFKEVPSWHTVPADCGRTFSVWDGKGFVHAPGCDPLLKAIASRREDYNAAVDQLLSGPFAVQTLTEKIDRWAKFIHDAAVADPTVGGEGPWMASVEELKRTIPGLRDRLKAIRDGR